MLIRELRDGTLRVVSVAPDGGERVVPWMPLTPRLPKPPVVLP
ncbi:MAG TPA: hypothetical protein VFK16_04140 [Gemmatimonadaceae bacterium]|nr:hypothetical protein [Gemmatimonadaceae bacterium]